MKPNKHISGLSLSIFISLLISHYPCIPQDLKPAYQADAWVHTSGPIGGLGYDIRYKFDDHNIWYVTDAWSGFHISYDRGLTWTPSNTGITSRKGRDAIPVFCATVDPHSPSTIWIGTDGTGDIFKSIDGGQTWVIKSNGIDPGLRPLSFRGITIDPRTSDIMYIMGEIGSSGWTSDKSSLTGLEMDLTQGIVYKTIDGGENWKQIWRGNNLARYCWINPRDPDILYVSTGIFDREAANSDTATGFAGGVGIIKSTDGGDTWKVLNQENGLLDLYVGSLYMHPENPDTLLAAASQNNWSGYGGTLTHGVYLTTNGGETWDRVLSQEELFSVVEYSTVNPNIAYALSSDAVYRSHDAGFTWQRFSRSNNTWGSPGTVAGFPIDMQCDPEDPMRIIVNNYLGGNFLSTDGGETWTLASKGYTGALVHHITVVPSHPEKVYAGSRSGVYRSDNGGEDWIGLVNPPEDMFAKFNEILTLAVDPENPDHVLTLPCDFGTVLYSYNGGKTWEIGQFVGGGISDLVFAPSDPSIVYTATAQGFWWSSDGGDSLALVNSEKRLTEVEAIAVHPEDPNTIFCSTSSSGLLKSTNSGKNWEPIGTGFPSLPAATLCIIPSNPEIIYAGINNDFSLAGAGIYKSIDGGKTWAQSGAGMEPNAAVLSIVSDPTNEQVVYAIDHPSGVYVSTNGGAFWQAINNGMDHRTTNELSLSNDGTVLYAATMGAGVYRLGELSDTYVENEINKPPHDFYLEQNYPNPFNPSTSICFSLPQSGFVVLKLYDLSGKEIKTILTGKLEADEYRVILNAENLPSGIYFYRLESMDFVETRKLILLK